MQPASFDYQRPQTLAEVIDLLGENREARVLAGGHSLIPLMKLRVASPATLVDIGRIEGLSGITKEGDHFRIGATTTHATIADSEELRRDCPILVETAANIGDLQVRNMGTIGGSLAHADPGADFPTTVMALEGTIIAHGAGGERQVPAVEFFADPFTTALQPGELLTSVSLPAMGKGSAGCYLKHPHPASRYAVVGVAALVTMADGSCSSARLVVGGVTGIPVRVSAAEEALTGREPDEEAISAAAAEVAGALPDPLGDTYASGEYRVHLAGVMAARALRKAVERAG